MGWLSKQREAAQFVPLRIAADTSEGEKWRKRFPHVGKLPVIYVIRADGKQLYTHSGVPPDLAVFLGQQLQQSGRILSRTQMSRLRESVGEAQRSYFNGDQAAAAEIIARHAEIDCFAEPAMLAKQLSAKLSEQAERALVLAEGKLGTKDRALDGALLMAGIERDYGNLPAVKNLLDALLPKHRANPQTAELLSRAKLLQQAADLFRRDRWNQAEAKLREIIARYPDTATDALARRQLAQIVQAEAEQRAAAHLRLARKS
ncbi:MAG: hypothetical protein N2C14_00055, partial [Planctomycetales bacterium]